MTFIPATYPPYPEDIPTYRLPITPRPPVVPVVYSIRFGEEDWIKECSPTLDNWCKRHGLTLKIFGHPGDQYPTPKFCIIRILWHFVASKAPRMLILDADVYVHPSAPVPDLTAEGIHIRPDRLGVWSEDFKKWLPRHFNEDAGHHTYLNAGIWGCDQETAKRLLEEMEPPFIERCQEQHQFNWWIMKSGVTVHHLPKEWNTFYTDKQAGWFVHLAGGKKMQKLRHIRNERFLPRVPEPIEILPEPVHDFAIVYLYRHDKAIWEELRYSLRSIQKHFKDKTCPIFIFGTEKPDWLQDGARIQFVHCPSYPEALVKAVQAAKRVLLMNDDIQLLKPAGPEDFAIGVQYGTIHDHLEDYVDNCNSWFDGLGRVAIDLMHYGFDEVHDFSTHTPYLFERERALEIMQRHGVWYKVPFETAYFNGLPHRPCGKMRALTLPACEDATVLNFLDDRLRENDLTAKIEAMFPDPAPWEIRRAKIKWRLKEKTDGPVYEGGKVAIPCPNCP